jgi:hypothetical protein
MINSGNEIISAMGTSWEAVIRHIENLPDDEFVTAAEGKWTPGQHLEHLLRSAVPLRKALGYPKFVIRIVAGKPNRTTRTFDQTKARYQEKLSQGGQASGRYIPPPVPSSDKNALLNRYTSEKDRMLKKIGQWSEKNLDAYLLPHPLLGKITVREMLFFTTFHTDHHLNIMKKY